MICINERKRFDTRNVGRDPSSKSQVLNGTQRSHMIVSDVFHFEGFVNGLRKLLR